MNVNDLPKELKSQGCLLLNLYDSWDLYKNRNKNSSILLAERIDMDPSNIWVWPCKSFEFLHSHDEYQFTK